MKIITFVLFLAFGAGHFLNAQELEKPAILVQANELKLIFAETEKKAQAGDTLNQYELGMMYYKGKGVTLNQKEAIKWFTKAAEKGNSDAQYSLAIMYYRGEGLILDYKKAFKWFLEAAEQKNVLAQYNLGVMYYKGEGVTQDHKESLKWYKRAADLGNAEAQYSLGFIYYNDNAIAKDYLLAHMWANIASAHAQENEIRERAIGLRDEIALKMTKNQIMEAQRLAKEWTAQQ